METLTIIVNGAPYGDERVWNALRLASTSAAIGMNVNVFLLGNAVNAACMHGVFAHGQAEVVARNIISEIMGNGEEEWKGDGSCFIEVGFGKAAMAKGNFYTEPDPVVKIRWPRVSRIWHWYKVLFEKYWLWRWF